MIGWTTVHAREDAFTLSKALLQEGLAVCVHIEGPITSLYPWEGDLVEELEHKITVKFLENNALSVKKWIEAHHPYQVPEWVAARAADVSEAYLHWAQDT